MAEDKETQRLNLAVKEAVRRKLEQYAKQIPVVDGSDKSDLRKWLQGVDHARDSADPGDSMILDMIGPLVSGAMGLFVRNTLKAMKDKKTWVALRTAIVNQYLGKGESRYWKNRVEKIKQDSGETVREYAGRFMYQAQQAYTPVQLAEGVLTERLINKFVQGIHSRVIRGTVSMIIESELEKLEQRMMEEEEERERLSQEALQPSTSQGDGEGEAGSCRLHHAVEGLDLQKLVDMAATVAFGYEKDEEEEIEVAALPPPPPALLQPAEETPQIKEMTGTFKSFQKDFRTFMTQQQDRTKKLHEEICALKEARKGDTQHYSVPVLPVNGMGSTPGMAVAGPPQIYNYHYGNWDNMQSGGGRGRGRGGPGRMQCWGCGQVGHLKRECPLRGQVKVQPGNFQGNGYYNGSTGDRQPYTPQNTNYYGSNNNEQGFPVAGNNYMGSQGN